MKYLVTFQDRVKTAVVDAENANAAAAKAYKNQKSKDKLLVIATKLISDK
jgi:predicted ThiF/HesA family dinucleotide-utilizing enzyme